MSGYSNTSDGEEASEQQYHAEVVLVNGDEVFDRDLVPDMVVAETVAEERNRDLNVNGRQGHLVGKKYEARRRVPDELS